jgi:hypothetical protein
MAQRELSLLNPLIRTSVVQRDVREYREVCELQEVFALTGALMKKVAHPQRDDHT